MDIANICLKNCTFCYTDALHPNRTENPKFISLDSWRELLKDPRFVSLIGPVLRFGSSGDVGDHPKIVELIQSTLEAIPDTRLSLWTNYRHIDRERIRGLIELCRFYNDKKRIALKISTNPLNQRMLENDVDALGIRHLYEAEKVSPYSLWDSPVQFNDAAISTGILPLGRRLNQRLNKVVDDQSAEEKRDRDMKLYGGLCGGAYLNADGLFLMIYAGSVEESYTNRRFARITSENFHLLAQTPFISYLDLEPPPHWPGGQGSPNRGFSI
jgi:hypothetical protein